MLRRAFRRRQMAAARVSMRARGCGWEDLLSAHRILQRRDGIFDFVLVGFCVGWLQDDDVIIVVVGVGRSFSPW